MRLRSADGAHRPSARPRRSSPSPSAATWRWTRRCVGGAVQRLQRDDAPRRVAQRGERPARPKRAAAGRHGAGCSASTARGQIDRRSTAEPPRCTTLLLARAPARLAAARRADACRRADPPRCSSCASSRNTAPCTALFAAHALLPAGWARDVLLAGTRGRAHRASRPAPPRPPTCRAPTAPSLPGMPNLHSHAFQRAFAGLTEYRSADSTDDSFWTWRDADVPLRRAT